MSAGTVRFKRRCVRVRKHFVKKARHKRKKTKKAYRLTPYLFSIRPVVRRFFFVPSRDLRLAEEQVLALEHFVDDYGNPAEKFLHTGLEGYSNLYINGVMQEGALYQVEPQGIRLQPTGQKVLAGTPIILESVHFTIAMRRKSVKTTRGKSLRKKKCRK